MNTAANRYKLACYTTDGSEYYGGWSDKPASSVGGSLHLALSSDGGKTFLPLNANVGVLFARADYSDTAKDPVAGDEKYFKELFVWKNTNGGYEVIARIADVRDDSLGDILLYHSDDLKSFRLCGTLPELPPHEVCDENIIKNAKVTSVLDISKEEYDRLMRELRLPVAEKAHSDFQIPDRADPCILFDNETYYFTATRDNGSQSVIFLRISDTLEGLATAEDHLLLTGETVWAPELHRVGGRLMLFFASGKAWDHVQSHVMVLHDESNITNPSNWSKPMRIKKQNGRDFLIETGITLDMTCFEYRGIYYLAWAQRELYTSYPMVHGSSDIYIAQYDPMYPDRLNGEAFVISKPEFGWERSMTPVNEGSFTLQHNGRLYMTIAVNATNYSYGIKLLTLKENGDPLKSSDWIVRGYPLLCTAMNPAEPGPGHSSFTKDKQGNDVLVYHWGCGGSHRQTTVRKVCFVSESEIKTEIINGEKT